MNVYQITVIIIFIVFIIGSVCWIRFDNHRIEKTKEKENEN